MAGNSVKTSKELSEIKWSNYFRISNDSIQIEKSNVFNDFTRNLQVLVEVDEP